MNTKHPAINPSDLLTQQTLPLPNKPLSVGIIGAGTAGVYLTHLLNQIGHNVTLFEQAPYPRAEGCGIMLVSAGMEALLAGSPKACEAILQAGTPAQTFEFRNFKDKVVSFSEAPPVEDHPPSMLVHRADILNALLNELPTDCLQTDAQLLSVSQTHEGVTASFKDGHSWQGDILVGADGIFSTVRQYVQTGVSPNYLGDIVWRGVVPDTEFCVDGNFKVYIRTQGTYANFFDMGNGQTHWGFFIEQDQAPDEIGKGRPNDIALPLAELAKLPAAARAMIESTPTEAVKCRFSYDIDPLQRLHNNRVVLMGDAAHAKSPSRARGMTSALEDALALSRHLSVSSTAKLSVGQILNAFETERLPIVHEYQRSSREISLKTGRMRKKKAA